MPATLTIPAWSLAAETCFGPERHLTTNVAACESTTAANTYAVMANSSRKENGIHANYDFRLHPVYIMPRIASVVKCTQ